MIPACDRYRLPINAVPLLELRLNKLATFGSGGILKLEWQQITPLDVPKFPPLSVFALQLL